MLTFIISTWLLISKISSAPIATCSDQQNCLNAESLFDVESDSIEICLSYDNTPEQCAKEDSISYACFNEDEEDKIEGFGAGEGETGTMCIIIDCKRDAAPEERFVEFGLKDGRGCSDSSSTANINGFTDECRSANVDINDVLCGGKQNGECIHRLFYTCPTPTTQAPGNTDDGSKIPTCEQQYPCLSININYDDCNDGKCVEVSVGIKYDDSDPLCTKDPEPISHVCFGSNELYDGSATNPNGSDLPDDNGKINDFPAGGEIILSGDCDPVNNYVEIGFKDAQGCGSDGDDEGVLQLDIDYETHAVTCVWDPTADICNGGNVDQCIYKISYDASRCDTSGRAMLNEKQDSKNVFGMVNASESSTISVWSVIIIGGLIIVLGIIALGYWYLKLKGNGRIVEKEMEVITAETPISPQSPETVGSYDIETNVIIENNE